MSQDETEPVQQQSPFITLPLVLLKEDFFVEHQRGGHYMLVSYQTAMLIAAADPQKKYFHCEYPTKNTPNSYASLWLIQDYRRSQERAKQLKLESELYRQKSYVMQQNLDNLCYRISKITGLSKTDDVVMQIAKNSLDRPEAYESFQCKRIEFDEVEFTKQWKEKNK